MADTLITGDSFSFTTINASILGAMYENVRITGIVEYSLAKLIDPNIDSTQASLLPYLDANASTKQSQYEYYTFVTQTGVTKVFAKEWIVADSIVKQNNNYIDIRITGATSSDLIAIRNVLGLSGWSIVNELT